jgi:hypothetical protein
MKKTCIAIAALVVGLSSFAAAQTSDRAGSSGALFLKLGMSPRAAALGNTYVAIADDVSGIFLNPAAIVGIEGHSFFVAECEYLIDTRAVAGVYSFPMPEGVGGRGAVHYTGFLSGDMTMTTATDIDGTAADRTFAWNELAIGFTYAREFTDRFAIGGGVKFIRTDAADLYSQTFGFDIGTLYRSGWRNFRIGMAVTNFGPDMRFNGRYTNTYISSIWQVRVSEEFGNYPLPIALQVGIADELYTSDKMRVTGAVDYSHPNDLAERVHVGAEFGYDEMFFLRGGFFMDMDKSEVDDPGIAGDEALDRFMDFRFGAGFKISNVVVDYAWQDLADLGTIHRFSLGFSL